MVKAFAYLRVSGKGQVEGDGFTRQLDAITKYAAASGITVARVFEERGVSGSVDNMDRPAWVEMIGCILANGVKTVIIEGLDRLARSQGIQEYVLMDLRRRGIALISTKEPDLESDDPTRVMFRQIVGAVAQYEKSMLVLKMKGAKDRIRRATGRCEGRKPFGYRPGESTALEAIQKQRAAGASLQAIADHLNAIGAKPRKAAKWYPSTILSALNSNQNSPTCSPATVSAAPSQSSDPCLCTRQ